ncbi:putative LRR receptor-like serine/threonine-protein kinase RKF3 [Hibiscus syriacus]|uniref:non-specific serine/threonine protein kinase n=1 Tax=Hibiscus syriacus TaxID=106335 RepID=A0A6A2YHJ0_HIBSY|nr:probable LRR receptor-like serine/threonine-protein kinase RKF3 [Hibiscus syriacus]KAE8675347.1 putative LRR receptor-like serine/threonine-protein kinase RKF3 [Hibiscus syriacus]
MSSSPFTFFALVTVLTSYCLNLSNGTHVNASCPLNFDILKKLANKDPARSILCQNIMEGIDLVRSEYLRTTEYFVPPPETSEACRESYRLLLGEFVTDFDIETSCGYNVEWISKACRNITSRAQFESLIPSAILYQLRYYCTQSLDNNFTCGLCTRTLLVVREVFLDGIDDDAARNISSCSGYPKMYTAAFVNHFGPTDRATAKCLFSIALEQEKPSRSHYRSVIAGATAGSVVGILGAFSAVSFLLMRRCRKKVEEKNDLDTDETSLVFGFGLCSRSTSLKKFKLKEIKNATKNFSRENIIGMGSYGNVYKGILPDGSEVAIKRLKNCSVVGDANFVHEVEVIASVRHVNLVALRGFCTATVPLEGHQRLIVCDLMRNGSLYDHLFGSGNKKLSWPIRLKIALGTARGLAYLHHGVHPAIIHRDIKASNILLDEIFEPKVADFGLAKIKSEGMTHLSTTVAGTLGYVAPEYALYGKLTEKSDIYSFGVVLLELLSGKKAYENDEGKIFRLTDWAWELVEQGRALDVIEQDMPEIGLPEVMEQYVLIAVLCSHSILDIRPTMDQIVKILETGFQPGFSFKN